MVLPLAPYVRPKRPIRNVSELAASEEKQTFYDSILGKVYEWLFPVEFRAASCTQRSRSEKC